MRVRNSALTESGLLSARDTEAIDTPACAATARIPCLGDRSKDTVMAYICNVTLNNGEPFSSFILILVQEIGLVSP
jgi:hypothetical protein